MQAWTIFLAALCERGLAESKEVTQVFPAQVDAIDMTESAPASFEFARNLWRAASMSGTDFYNPGAGVSWKAPAKTGARVRSCHQDQTTVSFTNEPQD